MKRWIALIALVFATAFPILAQDATAEPVATQEVAGTQEVIVIITQTPVVAPTLEPTATPEPDQPPVVPVTGSGSILLIIIALLAAIAGGGGVVAIIGRFRKDSEGMRALEMVGDSISKQHADKLLVLIDTLVAGLSVGREALDHIPAGQKSWAMELAEVQTGELIAELSRRGYSAAPMKLDAAPGATAG